MGKHGEAVTRLRRALPSEARALTELAVRSKRAWGYDDAFMQRVMPDMIVRPEYLIEERGIVAEIAGIPVGYAILRVDGRSAFLRDLFVEPDRMRTGIGSALFREATQIAREQRAATLTLEGDPNAIGFYRRMGMHQVGEEPSIAGEGRMLPVMSLELTNVERPAPTIETARLILRDWRDDDVEPWVALNADPRVAEYLGRSFTPEFSEAAAIRIRAALRANGYGWWAVEIRGGAPFAGVICLQDVPFDAPFTPAREIGWRLSHEHWGKGYATEGARAALDFAFERLGWNEVVAFTAASNVRSQRVMERLGMTHDPGDDFEHPRLAEGHPLRRHLLYRIRSRPGYLARKTA